MPYQILMPPKTIVGENAVEAAKNRIKELGSKALIISGKIVEKSGIVKELTNVLDGISVSYEVFTDITGEPDDIMIAMAKKAYENGMCDMIIGIGGGSPLDSAKAVSAASGYPPIVLIPTTSGSGSEATKFYCVTESATNTKKLVTDEKIIPKLSVIDPRFSVSAPRTVTAATGMDAFTHAVEAYISKKATPYTDIFALSAIKRIYEYLPLAYENGKNMEARTEMAFAAYEAGVCINNASVTLVHGMSRPIGAMFHVPHGISNAMLIVKCLEYVKDGCVERFADIGRVIGAAGSNAECANAFFVYLGDLCRTVEIPTLNTYGIEKESFFSAMDKMAEDALASGSPGNTGNGKEITKSDIIKIYTLLWE